MKALTRILFALLLTIGVKGAYADTEDRHLSGFKAVSVAGSFDVYITQGSTESVKVEAPDDVIDHIKTEVDNGVLKIYRKTNNNWNFTWFGNHKKIAIYVSAKDLNSVSISGSGDVYFKNGIKTNSLKLGVTGSGDMLGRVDVNELESSISGSGDMKVSGHAARSVVRVVGSGDFTGSELLTDNTSVHVAGSGDASVNANDKIDASVTGSGDIRYTGAAKSVSTSKAGSGSIHRF